MELTEEEKVVIYERSPFYYETDRMGIVHHSNFVRWLEEARVNFVEHAGYRFDEMEARGIMSPVLNVEVEYKIPVRFGEKIRIEVTQTFFNGVRVNFNYRILSQDSDEIRAIGASSHCFIDQDFKPVSLKRSYRDIYDLYERYTLKS